jgi:protein-L-isoaspartate(D-aspartate) O-methyltransferase
MRTIMKVVSVIINLVFSFLLIVPPVIGGPADSEKFARERSEMVQTQITRRGIKDEKTLHAMRTVPRHNFVPERYLSSAYADRPLPIGEGQTISQPYIVALMTETLHLKSTDTVLEIGTGSGYQAAILSTLCKRVYSIEIIPSLGEKAKQRMGDL